MLNVIISGCNGHMGRVVESLCAADPEVQVAAGFDVLGSTDREFPVYSSPAQFQGRADAVIDFSSPAALEGLLAFGKATKTPLILATTGYTPEQVAQIGAAALEVPIFRSANMSLGINVLLELVKKAASILGDSYDIEIVERHHRRKVDAPSGTALMIADAAAQSCGHETEYVFERHSVRHPRDKKEIGISAVRGGHHRGGARDHLRRPRRDYGDQTHRPLPGDLRPGGCRGRQVHGRGEGAGAVRHERAGEIINPIFRH